MSRTKIPFLIIAFRIETCVRIINKPLTVSAERLAPYTTLNFDENGGKKLYKNFGIKPITMLRDFPRAPPKIVSYFTTWMDII